jgi:DNA-binding MarR family transcriptional regulator
VAVEDFRRDLRVLEREVARQLDSETACCGVTLPQCHVLLELSFSDLSLTGLTAALDLDKSTLSRTVEALVKAGLVERAVAAGDRRSLRLTLSGQGRARVRAIDEMCNRHYAAVLRQMGAADRRQALRLVRLLAVGMRRVRVGEAGQASCCAPDRSAGRNGSPVRAARAGRTRRRFGGREA